MPNGVALGPKESTGPRVDRSRHDEAQTPHAPRSLLSSAGPSDSRAGFIHAVARRTTGCNRTVTIAATVTAITAHQFEFCASLRSVVFESLGVLTTIGQSAFHQAANLSSIRMPDSVLTIQIAAFLRCTSLEAITLPQLLLQIEYRAFESTGLRSIVLPSRVTALAGNVFKQCTALGRVDLSAAVGLRLFEAENFEGCTRMRSINMSMLPFTELRGGDFRGCTALTEVALPVSLVSIGRESFASTNVSNISLGSVSVDSEAFFESACLASLYQPNTTLCNCNPIGCLEDRVNFRSRFGCSAVITLPANVTSVEPTEFRRCTSVINVSVERDSQLTLIGAHAFEEASSLVSIALPDSLQEIGLMAFLGCTQLSNLTLPNGILRIMTRAFEGCRSLVAIRVPPLLTSIGEYAFVSCDGLTVIDLSAATSLHSLGEGVFHGALSVGAVNMSVSPVRVIPRNLLAGAARLEIVVFPEGITTIGICAFCGAGRLDNLVFPASIQTIEAVAFRGGRLTNVTIPSNVSLGSSAFERAGCRFSLYQPNISLCNCDTTGCVNNTFNYRNRFGCNETVSIPADVAVIESAEFFQCGALRRVIFGAESILTSIGQAAFSNARQLVSLVRLPDTVTSIGIAAFSGTDVVLDRFPLSLTYLGSSAFMGTELRTVILPPLLTSLEYGVFSFCSHLTMIDMLPATSLRTVAAHICNSCTALEVVIFSDSITFIAGDVFIRSNQLNNLILPAGVTLTGSFDGLPALTNIHIPGDVTIGAGSFTGAGCPESVFRPNVTLCDCIECTTLPTRPPTHAPAVPSTTPSHFPTAVPTPVPTTARPASSPTQLPTVVPTTQPTSAPTQRPTAIPTVVLRTTQPSFAPAQLRTRPPTLAPIEQPTTRLTSEPTPPPSRLPTDVSTPPRGQSTPTAAPNPADPCRAIACVLDCNGTCGWDGGADVCVFGEITSATERLTEIGCLTQGAENSRSGRENEFQTLVIVVVLLVVVGTAIATAMYQRGRRQGNRDRDLTNIDHTNSRGATMQNPVFSTQQSRAGSAPSQALSLADSTDLGASDGYYFVVNDRHYETLRRPEPRLDADQYVAIGAPESDEPADCIALHARLGTGIAAVDTAGYMEAVNCQHHTASKSLNSDLFVSDGKRPSIKVLDDDTAL